MSDTLQSQHGLNGPQEYTSDLQKNVHITQKVKSRRTGASRRTANSILLGEARQRVVELEDQVKHLEAQLGRLTEQSKCRDDQIETSKRTQEALCRTVETLNQMLHQSMAWHSNTQSYSTNHQPRDNNVQLRVPAVPRLKVPSQLTSPQLAFGKVAAGVGSVE